MNENRLHATFQLSGDFFVELRYTSSSVIRNERGENVSNSRNQDLILQAIRELSSLVKENKTELKDLRTAVETNHSELKELRTVIETNHKDVMSRIDAVEENLSEKIRKVDAKVTILSNELLETKADVLRLQQAR